MSSTTNNDHVMSYDMRFHAFVLAAPRVKYGDKWGIGQPSIAMNGGDRAALVQALRIFADSIEQDGTKTLVGKPLL